MFILIRDFLSHLVRWRIKSIEGLENIPKNEPLLFVSNHVGEQDPVLIYSALIRKTGRQIHTIAKWKIFRGKFWQKYFGTIPIYKDRSKSIEYSINIINNGGLIIIFPEGGVNLSNEIGQVKTGAARIALQTKVKVIPIGVTRTNPMPKTEFGHILDIFFGCLKIRIGSPIYPHSWYNRTIDKQVLNEVNYFIMSEVALLANKKIIK